MDVAGGRESERETAEYLRRAAAAAPGAAVGAAPVAAAAAATVGHRSAFEKQ